MKIGKHNIEISNEDKVLFPDVGITKGDLIDYYDKISEYILKHLNDRPVSMLQAPDGIREGIFFRKEIPEYFPDWIDAVEVELKEGGTQKQVIINDKATLIYLANQACVTPHTWLSIKGGLNKPDKLVFDLDPEKGTSFKEIAKTAKIIHDEISLSYVMTTGGDGMHVVIPLDGKKNFDQVREKAKAICSKFVEKYPDELTLEMQKDKREGKIFLDYLRNSYGQTSVPPYAVRTESGAPVATPLSWDELDDNDLNSKKYDIKNIFKRLSQIADPWKDFGNKKVNLDEIELK